MLAPGIGLPAIPRFGLCHVCFGPLAFRFYSRKLHERIRDDRGRRRVPIYGQYYRLDTLLQLDANPR